MTFLLTAHGSLFAMINPYKQTRLCHVNVLGETVCCDDEHKDVMCDVICFKYCRNCGWSFLHSVFCFSLCQHSFFTWFISYRKSFTVPKMLIISSTVEDFLENKVSGLGTYLIPRISSLMSIFKYIFISFPCSKTKKSWWLHLTISARRPPGCTKVTLRYEWL